MKNVTTLKHPVDLGIWLQLSNVKRALASYSGLNYRRVDKA